MTLLHVMEQVVFVLWQWAFMVISYWQFWAILLAVLLTYLRMWLMAKWGMTRK